MMKENQSKYELLKVFCTAFASLFIVIFHPLLLQTAVYDNLSLIKSGW